MVNRTDINESHWYKDNIPEDIKRFKEVQEFQEKIKMHYDAIKEHYDYQGKEYKKLMYRHKCLDRFFLYNICFTILNAVVIAIYIYYFSSKI